jgi:hypothetical protein
MEVDEIKIEQLYYWGKRAREAQEQVIFRGKKRFARIGAVRMDVVA